ncbi:Na+/H+ antiporter [Massilia forsythiae]|uniref:Na+/H+ antiporter n=1 Tax=Massilia forsythiae TaxID=2728020 RepID=A0A7Z2VYA0_9BURK|nr:Na+/H+ antiporter [Massilia forsythiae]QJE01651.1 Na+/H+ antiporter [Massilia forsythiae]
MESVEVVLAMLLAVIASGYLGRMLPFAVPLPLIQIALGAVISGVFKHGIALEPDIFFLLFLPPLLFLDGWRIPKVGLFRDKGTIIELALGLVLFTVLGAGFLMHWLIPAMPLPVAFALAAIVAPTDPVAVSAITSRIPVPPRLMHIIEGESLLNDASGLVCFRFAVAAAMTGQFSLAKASATFLWVALGGIAAGVLVTLAISRIHTFVLRRFGEDQGVPILVNLLMPFGAYLVAERLEASGILAAVAAGVTMSYVELSGIATPATRIRRNMIWDTLQFALNGVMFVLLGEQLPDVLRGALHPPGGLPFHPWWLAGMALALSLGLVALRFVWVWVSLSLTLLNQRRLGQQVYQPRLRLVLATSFAGVRGALTLAGVLTLPLVLPDGSPFPARHLAILLAAAVIVVSLVLASVALPRLLRGLEVPHEATSEQDEDEARNIAIAAAVTAIEKAGRARADAGDRELHAQVSGRVANLYRQRLRAIRGAEGDPHPEVARDAERDYRLTGLNAERDTILRMGRRGEISDETARKLLHEIDLVEARYG